MPYPFTAQDQLTAAELDNLSEFNIKIFTTGEAYDVLDALYLKTADGKVYKTDADAAESSRKFIGFAKEASTGADETKAVIITGMMTGLAGLTPGATYYTQAVAGDIGTAPGTYKQKVGVAISATALFIDTGTIMAAGTVELSGSANSVITCGFKPRLVIIEAFYDDQEISHGLGDGSKNECIYEGTAAGAAGIDATKAWRIDKNANKHDGVVDTLTETSFRLIQVKDEGGDIAVQIRWTAFG